MIDFAALSMQCAPDVHVDTMRRIVHVESSFNPYAIGVVGGRLQRQPKSLDEALATAKSLDEQGFNFSVGAAQVNKYNLEKYGLTMNSAFDPCANLRAGSEILKDCYLRAYKSSKNEQTALRDSFSCYYSGNFTAGYKLGYVKAILAAENSPNVIPAIRTTQDPPKYKATKPRKESAATDTELPRNDQDKKQDNTKENEPKSSLLF
ncbi:lytic transglycosylase domain-containing protein (plasmid) [Ampullimonas aquatilis]|uniref:lytic transglycosylase domain-containing protein n=1 Tax=Ampullimonas aquatilis TaxID=1341549 RepID=UPI003C776262